MAESPSLLRPLDLEPGELWRSRRDGQVFEIHYIPPYAPTRVQLKPARAKNLKRTRWLDIENLTRLYDHLEENDEPVSMTELDPGDVWQLVGGKRVDVIDRAFIYGGKRWVAVLDHDFAHRPVLIEVVRFNGGRLING